MTTILVTGASSGFGRLAAERLAGAGHLVFAGSRSGPPLSHQAMAQTEGLMDVELDVRDAASCRRLAELIAGSTRGLDVLVNNAGVLVVGPVETFSEDELGDMFETNVMGAIRMTQHALPMLRASRGRIVNVSSIAGVSAAPLYGLYSATKYALEGVTEALSFELLPFGVRTVLVRPGYHATGMRSHARRSVGFDERSPYAPYFMQASRVHGRDAERAPDPAPVVDAICTAALDDEPPACLVVGSDANLASRLRAANPDRLRDLMLARYGLTEFVRESA